MSGKVQTTLSGSNRTNMTPDCMLSLNERSANNRYECQRNVGWFQFNILDQQQCCRHTQLGWVGWLIGCTVTTFTTVAQRASDGRHVPTYSLVVYRRPSMLFERLRGPQRYLQPLQLLCTGTSVAILGQLVNNQVCLMSNAAAGACDWPLRSTCLLILLVCHVCCQAA